MSVRTFLLGVSRNEFLPSHLESLKKAFRNDDQSESVDLPKFWWILGADHLTLEGVMGDFRKKMSCRLISRGKKHVNKFLRENYPALKKISLMTYNAKKNLTPLYVQTSREVWEKFSQYKLNQ